MKQFKTFLRKSLLWFSKFFSAEQAESSKRFIAIFLVLSYVLHWYLLTYIKVEIANEALVKSAQTDVFILILVFGGFISYENY